MLMQKFLIGLVVLCMARIAYAEDLVPLFEDDIPNLGRNAPALQEIHFTPDALPDVQMNLKNTSKKPTGFQTTGKQKKPQVSEQQTKAQTPQNRRVKLAENEQVSSQTSAKMAEQLRAEMQEYKEQKEAEARAEQEAALAAAREAELAQQQQEQQAQNQPNPLTGLFRKLHDVYTFDISGFALGMSPDDILDVAEESGYKLTKLEHGIPLHRTSFYKENCQLAQYHRVDEIENCIIEQAEEDEMYYVSSMTFAKPRTAEFVQVLFTSPATENVAYKIYYENEGDNSLGFTRKNLAKKIARRDSFWKMVYDTYGYPDDADTFIWGDPQKASMHAQMQGSNYNAYLILEDKEIHSSDLIETDTTGKELPRRHTFTFAESEDD